MRQEGAFPIRLLCSRLQGCTDKMNADRISGDLSDWCGNIALGFLGWFYQIDDLVYSYQCECPGKVEGILSEISHDKTLQKIGGIEARSSSQCRLSYRGPDKRKPLPG